MVHRTVTVLEFLSQKLELSCTVGPWSDHCRAIWIHGRDMHYVLVSGDSQALNSADFGRPVLC